MALGAIASAAPENQNNLLDDMNGTSDILEEVTVSPKDKVKVLFQFMYYPEFITEEGYIIINENNLKVFGRITTPLYDSCTVNKFMPSSSLGVNESS
jgi:hypothetical protein